MKFQRGFESPEEDSKSPKELSTDQPHACHPPICCLKILFVQRIPHREPADYLSLSVPIV
jgi:hypothetical protein